MKASTEPRDAGLRRVEAPGKSDLAFRTIGEVAEELGVAAHVLRFWETKFPQIKPVKRGGGRRYYRPDDVALLRGVRRMLHVERYSIKGAQKLLSEQGVAAVVALGAEPEGRRARMGIAARPAEPAAPQPAPAEAQAFAEPQAQEEPAEEANAALFAEEFDLDDASIGEIAPHVPAPDPAPASAFRPNPAAAPETREIERVSAELRARLEAALKAAEEARALLARLEARRNG